MTDMRGFEEIPYNSMLGESTRIACREANGYHVLFITSISTRPFGICPGCVKVFNAVNRTPHWAVDAPDWSLGWGCSDPGLTAEFTYDVMDKFMDVVMEHTRRNDRTVPDVIRRHANGRLEFSTDQKKPWRTILVFGTECPNCHHNLKYIVNPYEMRGFWSCRGWPECSGPGSARVLPPGPTLLDGKVAGSPNEAILKSDNSSFWENNGNQSASVEDDIPF